MAVLSMITVSLYLLSSLLLVLHLVSAVRDGFSMKLIHWDSIESPFYPGSLTFEERAKRFHHQSMVRLNQVASTIRTSTVIKGANESDSVHPNMVGRPMDFNGVYYAARVGIGTFSTGPAYRSYVLIVDTGSDYTWLQCVGCNPEYCYSQTGPLFPYHESSTFVSRKCSGNPPSCDRLGYCWHTYCFYHVHYYSGLSRLSSRGMLGNETFTFESDNGAIKTIPNLIFGCGFEQKDAPFNQPTRIAGVLGLARAYPSFLSQIASRYEDHRFSYCITKEGDVFLGSGTAAQFRNLEGMISTTQLLIAKPDIHYYLQLRDISIAGNHLNLAPGTFARRPDGTGGCILDIGTGGTLIRWNVYGLITQRLVYYFQRLGVSMTQIDGYDLCFQLPNIDIVYPTMVYHFQGDANLEVKSGELFKYGDDAFCLTILPHDGTMSVLIGSYHQVNHRFVFDIDTDELSFAREGCK